MIKTCTKYGEIIGKKNNGVIEYLGIPFAKAPINDLAFKHPVEPDNWGVLECLEGKQSPIQDVSQFSALWTSEDCLYMNIFIPDTGKKKYPVVFWIYGGAYKNGGTGKRWEDQDYLEYDVREFVRDTDTIVVTFNYRLNIYGFMNFNYINPDRFDLNCGLYDQIMALKFVHENIENFHGDKDNVCIMGQSAGACSALVLMSEESIKDWFKSVIVMSPNSDSFFTLEESIKNTKKLLKMAKIKEENIDELFKLSYKEIIEVCTKYNKSILYGGDTRCSFSPVIDGILIKDEPKKTAQNCSKPMLIGNTKDEANLFVYRMPYFTMPYIKYLFKANIKNKTGNYRDKVCSAVTDIVFKDTTKYILKGYHGDAWLYSYEYVTPDNTIGCFHASDVPVLFNITPEWENVDFDETREIGKKQRKLFKEFIYNSSLDYDKNGIIIIDK